VSWRGTLAYYAAAVVCGSLFVALAYHATSLARWGAAEGWASGFLLVLILSFLGGAPALLAYAFIVRAVAGILHLHQPWQWLAAGGAVGAGVTWVFARLGYLIEATYFPAKWQSLKAMLVFPFMGPMMYDFQPWLAVVVGAATAWILHRIERPSFRCELRGVSSS
jgi:hypothetical protein